MLSPLSGASFVGKTGTTFHWRGPAGPTMRWKGFSYQPFLEGNNMLP
jgi:hypothetical protein